MAVLLFWLGLQAPAPDQRAWERMVERASQRSKFPGELVAGPGFALYAARARATEPPVIIRPDAASGRSDYLLLDRAVGPEDSADRATDRWPEAQLSDGTPTAAVRWDPLSRTMTLHRDIMGQRKLVYARVPGAVIVASGEDILRAHPDVSGDLDDLYMAAYFAALPPAPAETAFRDIRAVGAGETVEFLADGSQRSRVRRLSPDYSWKGMRDQAIVDRFGELLTLSVRNSCLGAKRVGISLSAGLDSSSIAACAARLPASLTGGLVAVTHRLADFLEIDESQLTAGLAQVLGIEHRAVAVDNLDPFCEPSLRPICPDTPIQWPFREWYEASYREFEAAEVDVWLSGAFGDHLFAGAVEWLVDALRFGRFGIVTRQIGGELKRKGWLGAMRSVAIRRPISRLLGRVAKHSDRLHWLRRPYIETVRDRLDDEMTYYQGFPRSDQCVLLLAGNADFDASAEQWYAQRHATEQRLPFRDPDLTRWCLSIPADFSFRDGQMKWVLRQAMRGSLPDNLRLRAKGSSLTPVFRRAMARARSVYAQAHAQGARHARSYIDEGAWRQLDPSTADVVHWLVTSIGSWPELRDRCGTL